MILENNYIELKVGDVFRFNRARKHCKVIAEFEHKGTAYLVYQGDTQYSRFQIGSKKALCSARRIRFSQLIDPAQATVAVEVPTEYIDARISR